MMDLLLGVAILGGLGIFFGTVLAIAYKKLRVEEDPRIDMVEEMLPGSNCGACGQPGCRAFAEKVIAGDCSPGQCTVSSPEGVDAIAEFLGVDAGVQEKRVARLLCAGGKIEAQNKIAYEGMETCRNLSVVSGGNKGCVWGCLGLGDCEVACTFDAIAMSQNGLPVVNVDKCTACGDCVTACPKDLFVIMPLKQSLIVQCKSLLEGEEAEELCSVACNACGRCAADAPSGFMKMSNNLPVIDYSQNDLANPLITKRCPTGAIVWVEGGQFQESLKDPMPLGRVDSFRDSFEV